MEPGCWEVALVATAPRLDTAPVLAVLVCHNGEEWLPEVLTSLRRLTVGPRHLVAVDTGSTDRSAELLTQACGSGRTGKTSTSENQDGEGTLFDAVLTLPPDTGFGAAVAEALEHAKERWGDPGGWLWLLHDDAAPEPDCLTNLLHVAEFDSTAAMLGPLGLDWSDPRLVVDAGLSTDASGHRQTGIGPSELDPALGGSEGVGEPVETLAVSEVLAVSTACALVRRDVFEQVGGIDAALPLACDDIDLGWRINTAGHLVLCVPGARMRHASALRSGVRAPSAVTGSLRAAERAHGVRTFLVNASAWSFVVGVPRLVLLSLLRMVGFALLRRMPEAAAESAVAGRLLTGRAGLLGARAARRAAREQRHGVRGLLTSRADRLRNGFRRAFAWLVRDRVRRDVVLGQPRAKRLRAVSARPVRPVGPDALPAGALPSISVGQPGARRRGVSLRRPTSSVVVPVPPTEPSPEPSPTPRPSPVPRSGDAAPKQDLLLVPMSRSTVLRELLLTPPVVLTVVLVLFSLLAHGVVAETARFGALQGGRLLPVADLGHTWSDYLASWHAVNGGTAAPAPAALLVLALFGTILAPLGGPSAVVTLLMLFGVPLAGMTTYAATRDLPVSRSWRAVAAAAYALIPAATLSAAQGRIDVVVVHILVPPLLAGSASVLGLAQLTPMTARSRNWLGTACLTALGLAVLGAFSPLMHVVLIVLALLGFVLVPGEARRVPRRVAGLTAIVVLPVACLLPWPVVLVENPQILLHGLGARAVEQPAGAGLLALSPDGSAVSAVGVLVVLAGVVSLMVAGCRAALPGLLVAAVGGVAAVVVSTLSASPISGGPSTVGWAGAPLLLVGAGLLWIVLVAARTGWRTRWRIRPKVAVSVVTVSLVVLASGAALAGRSGPLGTQRGETTPALASDLTKPGPWLKVDPGPQPARLVDGAQAHFGDDDLVPTATAAAWLRQVEGDLLSGDRTRVRSALAAAAARGAGYVAVPGDAAARVRALGGELLAGNGRLADGTEVLRVLLPSSPVALLGPDLARQARGEDAPRPQARPLPVEAALPHIAVRVSEGGAGRLLLLGAENEAGWQAEVDGRPAPLATAWGHQVAIPLPERASEVRVTYTELPRTTLLVLQAAAILFALIGALPSRRRPAADDSVSGDL